MRVILDECLPKRLTRELPGHDAVTVPMAGWAGIQNGDLLCRISGNFQAFLTIDGNLAHQQNTGKLPFGVIVLDAPQHFSEFLRRTIPRPQGTGPPSMPTPRWANAAAEQWAQPGETAVQPPHGEDGMIPLARALQFGCACSLRASRGAVEPGFSSSPSTSSDV